MKRLVFVIVAAFALAPAVLGSHVDWTGPARLLCLLLAAVGLNLAVGFAGEPSLAQGAFAGIGAFTTAILRARHGWEPVSAILAGVVLASLAGVVFARGVDRLRPPFVAIAGWAASWAFAAAVAAFPSLSGGASGLVLAPMRLRIPAFGLDVAVGPRGFFELALVCVVAVVGLSLVVRKRYGPALAVLRTDPQAAAGAGIDVARMRFGALVASAAIGGLAGGLLVNVDGVADPTVYGPILSATLFIAVLLGGAGTMIGPVLGVLALVVVEREAALFANAGPRAAATPLAAALTLAIVAVIGEQGIAAGLRRRRASPAPPLLKTPVASVSGAGGAAIAVQGLSVRFGAINALDHVSLSVPAGACSAVIGPNGSGKTTLLRVLSGAVEPGDGAVLLGGVPLPAESVRRRAERGVARTFQRTAIAAEPTALEHVLAGTEAWRRTGLAPALLRSPHAQVESALALAAASDALRITGLAEKAGARAGSLDAAEQRLLMIARALASRPRVLLLDEPSAGMRPDEEERLHAAIKTILERGISVLIVEHNLRIVKHLASNVTVLDAGRVIAAGSFADVADDPEVRAAYLGEPLASAHS